MRLDSNEKRFKDSPQAFQCYQVGGQGGGVCAGKGIPSKETRREGEQPLQRRDLGCVILEAERRAVSRRRE